jgi:hypothetical protein
MIPNHYSEKKCFGKMEQREVTRKGRKRANGAKNLLCECSVV